LSSWYATFLWAAAALNSSTLSQLQETVSNAAQQRGDVSAEVSAKTHSKTAELTPRLYVRSKRLP
jgi:hypothetical protein